MINIIQVRNPRTGQFDYKFEKLSSDKLANKCAALRSAQHDWWLQCIASPNSRDILQRVTGASLANDDFTFLSARELEVGERPAIVVRMSLTGELGYEIYVSATDLAPLYEQLKSAARDIEYELCDYGIYALLSLRLEKSYGIWSREYSPDYTPRVCGLDKFVAYEKSCFIGHDAALQDRDTEVSQKLIALEIDTVDTDVGGFEPIWVGKHMAGFITSGGYGHSMKKSLAMGYLQSEFVEGNPKFEVSILGERRPATMHKVLAYDADGSRMRN